MIDIKLDKNEKQIVRHSWGFYADTIQPWVMAQDIFTPAQCQTIIELGKKNLIDGSIGNDRQVDIEFRNSKINWIGAEEENQWIFRAITQALIEANDKFFQFDLWGMTEGLQFTEYSAPDGKYDYHTDSMYNNTIRKLSASVQLSDPNTYEGGDFEINLGKPEKLQKIQGSIIIFPSYYLHRINPVTKGVRHSLVTWITGPKFK